MNPECPAGFKEPSGHVLGLDRIGILESLEGLSRGVARSRKGHALPSQSRQGVENAGACPTRTGIVCKQFNARSDPKMCHLHSDGKSLARVPLR